MAGPWEQYQQTAEPSGPWTQYAATPKSLMEQIPGAVPTTAPTKPSMYQRALGVAEVPIGMLGGIVSGVAGPLANIYGNVTSGSFGQPEGVRAGRRLQTRAEQAVGYTPVTQPGAENIQAVGETLAPLIGVPLPTMNALARTSSAPIRLATNALRGEAELVSGAVGNLVKARSAATQAANEAKSYANAPQIEAAQTAQKLGLVLNPSISNPTAGTRAISALGGKEATTKLAQGNNQRLTNVVKQDLGDTTPGKVAPGAFENALNIADAPAEVVRKLPTLTVPDTAVQALNRIPKPPAIGGKAEAAKVASLVDDAITELNAGRSGAQVLNDIRKMRTDAQAVFKANDKGTSAPDSVATAGAQARMQIAKVLEDIIDANAPANVLPELRAGRVRSAQIFDHERAFDPATGKIDPQIYAKLLRERKGAMTGLPADIGRVAANYPEVMQIIPTKGFLAPRTYRGTLAGAAGAAMGYAAGGPIGAAVGGGLGSLGGAFAGNLAARRMASPAFQAKYAVPRDYRPNALAPAPPVNTLPVPFVSQGQPAPGQLITRPNWDYYREPQPSGVQVGVPSGAPQLAAPSSEATMANVAQQRAYELARDRAAAAAQEGAAANEPRNSGRQGVLLERDPVTGELRMAPEGGAPTTLAPSSLESAISKLSGVPTAETQTKFQRVYAGKDAQGANKYVQRPVAETVTPGENTSRAPTLTATEKIAWDRARSTLDTVLPGFNKLSDAQVTSKMMDRQWVADALKKSREKEAMWAEKANQEATTDRQIAAITDAANRRDALTALAEALQEQLGKARPVTPKGTRQGRVTRAAQRLNQLAPEDAVIVTPQNALIK